MPARNKTPVNRQRPYTTDKAARNVKKAPPVGPVSRASAHGRVVLTIPPPLAPRPLVGLGFDTYSAGTTVLQPARNVNVFSSTVARNDKTQRRHDASRRAAAELQLPRSSRRREQRAAAPAAGGDCPESTNGKQVPVPVVRKTEGGTSVTVSDVTLVKHLVDDNAPISPQQDPRAE